MAEFHRRLHGAVAGESVRLAQHVLKDAGFDPGRIDGVYGPDTARAVRAFQRSRGLAFDGLVGPATWAALAAERAGARLRRTALDPGLLHGAVQGEDVRTAQRILQAAGFSPGRIDAVYGPQTERAVLAFQHAHRLPPDGVIGPETWALLLAEQVVDAEDLSPAVADLRTRLPDMVTTFRLAAELLSGHVDGAGSEVTGTIDLGPGQDGAERQPVAGWIEEVRLLFQRQESGGLDGRKLLYGLVLLDQQLRRRVDELGLLAAMDHDSSLKGQLSGRGKARRRADAVPTLSDQPAEVDQLGRTAFAEVLAGRLRDEFGRTCGPGGKPDSFMLHLEGPWGSGKTSLLGFLERELRRRPEPWLVVCFNAWQNQRVGAPWWLLISELLRAAVRDPDTGAGLRFRLRLRALRWRLELAKAEIAVALLAVTVIGLLAGTGRLTGDDPLGILTGTISSLVAAVSGLHGLRSSVTGGSEQGANTFIRQSREPMKALQERFNKLVDTLHRPIAIFIDDLDRCRPDYVVELLEGVQTMFRGAPVAFVVAADRHWLYDAYAKAYGDYVKTGIDPGRPLGHLFLEKTFQLSTSVPSISPSDQHAFWKRLLSPAEEDGSNAAGITQKAAADFAHLSTEEAILGELDRKPQAPAEEGRARREAAVRRLASPALQRHLEHTLSPFAPLLEPNPRAMKRLVNAYGVARAVQILEGHSAELEHPRERLALWTILKSRWPLLSDYLADHPDAIDALKDNRVPDDVASDHPYLKVLFQHPDAARVARGDGLDGTGLDPASLRFLIEGPGPEPVHQP